MSDSLGAASLSLLLSLVFLFANVRLGFSYFFLHLGGDVAQPAVRRG